MSKNSKRIKRTEAAETIVKPLYELACKEKIPEHFWVVAGSYRRQSEFVGDIDLCIRQRDFGKWAFILSVMCEQLVVRKKDGVVIGGYVNETRIELYPAPDKGFGANLMYTTGSGDLNKKQREHATRLGMRLNEKGLWIPECQAIFFDSSPKVKKIKFAKNNKDYPDYETAYTDSANGKWVQIAGKTEEEVYQALELEFLNPKDRD